MTVEQKKEALYKAMNTAWDGAFEGWEDFEESEKDPNVGIMGVRTNDEGFAFYLAGCRDTYGGWIWVEYDPTKDIVGIFIKDRPIQTKFKEDLKVLFEKYSPFGMNVSYERQTTPVISRKEKVEPKDFVKFFREFRKAYNENYPLFYMFTVSAKEWYDGFAIEGADC